MKAIRVFLMAALAASLAAPVLADWPQWDLMERDNYHAVGKPEDAFEYFKADPVDIDDNDEGLNRQLNRCIAACVQMILNEQDLYVSQNLVIDQVWGDLNTNSYSDGWVRKHLNNWKPEKGVKVKASRKVIRASRIVADLHHDGPLMVGLEDPTFKRKNHAYVLLQVRFENDYHNNPVPRKVVLMNPWPYGEEKRVEMSWYDFENSVRWATRLRVVR